MDITQTFELQSGFFLAQRLLYVTMYFTVLENKNRNKVENPYYSLGLLQQTMVISSADHHDLSVLNENLLIYDGELQSNDRRGNFTFEQENFKA